MRVVVIALLATVVVSTEYGSYIFPKNPNLCYDGNAGDTTDNKCIDDSQGNSGKIGWDPTWNGPAGVPQDVCYGLDSDSPGFSPAWGADASKNHFMFSRKNPLVEKNMTNALFGIARELSVYMRGDYVVDMCYGNTTAKYGCYEVSAYPNGDPRNFPPVFYRTAFPVTTRTDAVDYQSTRQDAVYLAEGGFLGEMYSPTVREAGYSVPSTALSGYFYPALFELYDVAADTSMGFANCIHAYAGLNFGIPGRCSWGIAGDYCSRQPTISRNFYPASAVDTDHLPAGAKSALLSLPDRRYGITVTYPQCPGLYPPSACFNSVTHGPKIAWTDVVCLGGDGSTLTDWWNRDANPPTATEPEVFVSQMFRKHQPVNPAILQNQLNTGAYGVRNLATWQIPPSLTDWDTPHVTDTFTLVNTLGKMHVRGLQLSRIEGLRLAFEQINVGVCGDFYDDGTPDVPSAGSHYTYRDATGSEFDVCTSTANCALYGSSDTTQTCAWVEAGISASVEGLVDGACGNFAREFPYQRPDSALVKSVVTSSTFVYNAQVRPPVWEVSRDNLRIRSWSTFSCSRDAKDQQCACVGHEGTCTCSAYVSQSNYGCLVNGKCPYHPVNGTCSGHGDCKLSGRCACYTGWAGIDCSKPIPAGFNRTNTTCAQMNSFDACSGNGRCSDTYLVGPTIDPWVPIGILGPITGGWLMMTCGWTHSCLQTGTGCPQTYHDMTSFCTSQGLTFGPGTCPTTSVFPDWYVYRCPQALGGVSHTRQTTTVLRGPRECQCYGNWSSMSVSAYAIALFYDARPDGRRWDHANVWVDEDNIITKYRDAHQCLFWTGEQDLKHFAGFSRVVDEETAGNAQQYNVPVDIYSVPQFFNIMLDHVTPKTTTPQQGPIFGEFFRNQPPGFQCEDFRYLGSNWTAHAGPNCLPCDTCVHGNCVGNETHVHCECDFNWEGETCEISTCPVPADRPTDPCSGSYGGGICVANPYYNTANTSVESSKMCACFNGYNGTACEHKQCPTDLDGWVCGTNTRHPELRRGTCNATSGTCVCAEGWTGPACSLPACPIANGVECHGAVRFSGKCSTERSEVRNACD
jgi:hypothetical protein